MSTPAYFEKQRASANENYVGFAAQPAGGGMMNILSANDLVSETSPVQGSDFFQKRPLFVDNCQGCQKNNTMNAEGFSNADGGTTLGDIFATSASVFTSYQQSQAQQAQAAAAAQIAQAQAMQAAQNTANTNAQGSSISTIVKSWSVPILVGGLVIIGGFVAYKYFVK